MLNQAENEIINQYLQLCRNPLRSDEQVRQEYFALKHHPRVTNIGFSKDVMVVGTDMITISYAGAVHEIGEFIVFIIRRQVGDYWDVDFRFRNVTHIRQRKIAITGKMDFCHHPHIAAAWDTLLASPNGRLCINSGQFGVYQHLRKGEMHHAIPLLIELLEIYPTGTAYLSVETWPIKE